jgi:hypothetical protein
LSPFQSNGVDEDCITTKSAFTKGQESKVVARGPTDPKFDGHGQTSVNSNLQIQANIAVSCVMYTENVDMT